MSDEEQFEEVEKPFIPNNGDENPNKYYWRGRGYRFPKENSMSGYERRPPAGPEGYDSQAIIDAEKEKKKQAFLAENAEEIEARKEAARQRARESELRRRKARRAEAREAKAGEPAPVKQVPKSAKFKGKKAQQRVKRGEAAKGKSGHVKPTTIAEREATTTASIVTKTPTYRGRSYLTVEIRTPGKANHVRPMTASEHAAHYTGLADAAYRKNDNYMANLHEKTADFWAHEPEHWFDMTINQHIAHHDKGLGKRKKISPSCPTCQAAPEESYEGSDSFNHHAESLGHWLVLKQTRRGDTKSWF